MLRQCLEHGYFRGEVCSKCEEKGRFLMNTEELDRLGRIMAGVLRHFPERFNLDMDDSGFVAISEMIDQVKRRRSQFHWLRPHHIQAIVDTDPKGRYQIKESELVRATYGHSIDVELDFPVDDIPDNLYYPTTQEELDILLETGLHPSDRKCVHLSQTMNDALVAGRHRVSNPIILEIQAKGCMDDGLMIQHAGTTVYITKEVPPKYITVLEEQPVIEMETETKVEAAPEEPVEAAPEEPVEAAPEEPVEAAPEEPVEAAPEEPVEAAPEEPVEAAPEEPVEAAPEEPVEAAPEEPVESAPEEPVGAVPEE